jgi:hypothetical protein
MPLSSVVGAQSIIKPGVCTSSTRPAVPFEGQMIYETDTDKTLVWDGSTWIFVANPLAVSFGSSNLVSLLSNPSVRASRTGDLSYNNSTQNVPIIFNSTSLNVGSYYSTSTGVMTAPVVGDYFVAIGVYNAAGTDISQIWTIVNGTRGVSIVLAPAAGQSNLAGSGIVRLNAGDTFGMGAWFNGNTATITANGYHTYLNIRYIG